MMGVTFAAVGPMVAYAVAYLLVLLGFALWSFSRRDL